MTRTFDQMERDFMARFAKSARGHRLEVLGTDFVLLDRRFQRPSRAVRTEILRLLGLAGNFTGASFDLVMTPLPALPLTLDNVAEHLDGLLLIEMKTTAQPIRNKALANFFFGSSQTQYELSEAAGGRVRWAFVVLNDENDYGRPFFVLLTFDEVTAKTRTKRVQFQVNFTGRDMPSPADEYGPLPDPDHADLEHSDPDPDLRDDELDATSASDSDSDGSGR